MVGTIVEMPWKHERRHVIEQLGEKQGQLPGESSPWASLIGYAGANMARRDATDRQQEQTGEKEKGLGRNYMFCCYSLSR